MRTNLTAVLSVAALLGGCVAQANTVAEDPPIWGRVDCQRAVDNPIVQMEFEQARTICTSRAQAAAVAGTANMPGGRGLGGAMVAGINQGITANQIGSATANGCMGELGYLLKTRAEHASMCEAIADQKQRMAAAAAPVSKKRIAPAKPQALAPAPTTVPAASADGTPVRP